MTDTKKPTLKEARANLKEGQVKFAALNKKFKTAMDEGTITADETKEIQIEIVDMATAITELASVVAEGVPVEGGDGVVVEDNTGDTNNDNGDAGQRINTSQDEKNEDFKKKFEDQETKTAGLEKQVTDMHKEAKQKDLAVKYAQSFPESVREAKLKEFLGSKESLLILEARLKEAQGFSGKDGSKIVKEAALESGDLFSITEYAPPGMSNRNSGIKWSGKL